MDNRHRPELERNSKWIRKQVVQMAHNGKEGHLNGALSCVDILNLLFAKFDLNGYSEDRDRLYFSKGHAVTALYATMCCYIHSQGICEGLSGHFCLDSYNQPNSQLTPHPDKHLLSALEMSSGSLGHGLGVAAGAAYALKQKGSKSKCIVLLGDGECNEGSVWEAAQFAVAKQLDNLLVIIDANGTQSIDYTEPISGGASLAGKFQAFGFSTTQCDGHDFGQLSYAFVPQSKPRAVIAHTVAGKGVSFMEDSILWHYKVPDADEVKRAMAELDGVTLDMLSKDG